MRSLAHFQNCKALESVGLSSGEVTDTVWTNFQGCNQLWHLGINCPQVTDTGLQNFRTCDRLISLHLEGTQTTDAGLRLFEHCGLHKIGLSGTHATDAGLQMFENDNFKFGFMEAFFVDTAISDIGVACLGGEKTPRHLTLGGTTVTGECLTAFDPNLMENLELDRTAGN